MKHLGRHLKKTSKTHIKKTIATLVLLFFAMTILFQKDQLQTELQFVRNMDEAFIHKAPSTQRDYLFQDEGSQEIYQGTIGINDTRKSINHYETEQLLYELQNDAEAVYIGTLTTDTLTQKTEVIHDGSLDCITPRGEIIKNNDFVLAYEQRADVNTICNIEKRRCIMGILKGSFSQRSCRDDIVYEYRKAEIISYNQKVLNEYIQPTPPINVGATFDMEGKINGIEDPITTRGTINLPVRLEPEVKQIAEPHKKECTTPRNQTIHHGQFVKAYKTTNGFIDIPCEVELRACVDGRLKGNFQHSKCTFNNITYDRYITARHPTLKEGFLFFEWIESILTRGR